MTEGADSQRFALTPVQGGAAWEARLEEAVLTLHADDGRIVMMLPREEAAAHLRFALRLPQGRTLSFIVIEGLRSYTFRVSAATQAALLAWLPLRGDAFMAHELRGHGAAMTAAGFALHAFGLMIPGGLLQALGVLNLYAPRRAFYLLNSVVLSLLGLACLYLSVYPLPSIALPQAATAFGSVLLLWGIHQASIMGPQHRLEQTRRTSTAAPLLHADSMIPRVMAALCLLPALGFAVIAYQQRGSLGALVLYGTLLAASVVIAATILARGRYSYRELHVGGQWIVVLLYFQIYGIVWSYWIEPEYAYAVPPAILLAFPRVMVWAPLIAVVLIFNLAFRRVIARAVASED
ncbi:MAG: hypothetical protein GC168_03900 [Candidatus Hydrogenedens sp.]|nr:hypothetical protein [Candidatus Hydrogenedens sp.]